MRWAAVGVILLGLFMASHTKHTSKPHIVMVIVDDFGWGNAGFHAKDNPEVQTPHMDELVRDGIELHRHYVHQTCTPTRTSFQSGRLPVHVQLTLAPPCNAESGCPRNMTLIAEKMKQGGYETHLVGKWDVGMATPTHTPLGRGYDSALFYFAHGNWAWSKNEWMGSKNNDTSVPECNEPLCAKDLWDGDGPIDDPHTDVHEEYLFRERFESIIEQNSRNSKPMFLVYAPKLVHYPLEAPPYYQKKFSFIKEPHRMIYAAMVNFLDDQLKALTSALKKHNQWDNTLLVLTSDNGGFTKWVEPCDWETSYGLACYHGESGASNYPHRGGKYAYYEGGIRSNAFVSGGFVPAAVRGTRLEEMLHVADWYATFCALAGVDPHDPVAEKYGLPAVDSLNMWPLLSGTASTSPRLEIHNSEDCLLSGRHKVITGKSGGAEWCGPQYPNSSTLGHEVDRAVEDCTPGCLYDVVADPEERHNLASEQPELLKSLIKRKAEVNPTIYVHPKVPYQDPQCMKTSATRWHGFLGPWMELDDDVMERIIV